MDGMSSSPSDHPPSSISNNAVSSKHIHSQTSDNQQDIINGSHTGSVQTKDSDLPADSHYKTPLATALLTPEEEELVVVVDEDESNQLHFAPPIASTPLDELPPPPMGSTFSWGPLPSTSNNINNNNIITQTVSRGANPLASLTSSTSPQPHQSHQPHQPLELSPIMSAPNSTITTPAGQENGKDLLTTTNSRPPSTMTNNGRPNPKRMPSNAYAPSAARRPGPAGYGGPPGQLHHTRQRTGSTSRVRRANPNAEYRAQEKPYMQRIRQDMGRTDEYGFLGGTANGSEIRTPSLEFSDASGTDDEGSPNSLGGSEQHLEDPYEDTLLAYGLDEMQPSIEELKIPENRERLEWHSMLASVLTGDVVMQEKKRLLGGGDLNSVEQKAEIWIGLKARVCGRSLQSQRRLVEKGRNEINSILENIISFGIQGSAEAGKTPAEQVSDMVDKIEKCERLYPTFQTLAANHPKAVHAEYTAAYEAIIAWHNTMQLIDTELEILRKWVGNDELDFTLPRERSTPTEETVGRLADESSFVDRLLKEDGVKSLLNDQGLLIGLRKVVSQAKKTLIAHAELFQARHFPPYIEELQTLINFPSRLVKEIIRTRLSYARNIKDLSQQPIMTIEQMISQFQTLVTLAGEIKKVYNQISNPQAGWDPPDCIEENFDSVVVDALKFYFKLLNWKLSANKNAFKEAEIMESEWEYSTKVGRFLEGGDVEVAEQFSSLTAKSLVRLNTQFERELQKRPEELNIADMEKVYKTMLDSVRVRQRKLFRFSRMLTQKFENCAEYNINLPHDHLLEFYNALMLSGHFLVKCDQIPDGKYVIASPALEDRPEDVPSLLSTCYHAEDNPEDPTNPYVLVLRPESALFWAGKIMNIALKPPGLDLTVGRLRLVADGSSQRLADAKIAFMQHTGVELAVINEQRANLSRVNIELKRIKQVAFKLSNTIMNSVETIRKQTAGIECQELIQTCFAFATEFGQRSIHYMDQNRRALNNMKLLKLALDWISFICDDCYPSDRKTFRWAVVSLEFAMIMTQGQNILSMNSDEYEHLRAKVAGCMSLLVSHFDIMGARSTYAAQMEIQRMDAVTGKHRLDLSNFKDDEESSTLVRNKWMESLNEIDEVRSQKETERAALGRVLEDSNEAVRALTYLSSSSSNVHLRWQQGHFIGGGTFGSVYVAINLDTNELMAVKEIRLHDPQLIPTIVSQIRDEMTVLQVLDHPNIVSYYGIEPHRDKVYIFMEYCDGGSLAALLEHGRIEDETVVMVYAFQMLEGLAYLHERGVVHRDIKPENILLDHDGVIKFVDFGAAKVIARHAGKTIAHTTSAHDHHPSIVASPGAMAANAAAGAGAGANNAAAGAAGGRQNSMQGTPMYMSPEVIRGSSSGRLGAADIWSLGCVVLEMVTGRRPWASLDNEWAIMYNIAQGNTPQLPGKEQLSAPGMEFLEKCFDRDPNKRASAAELLQDPWIMELRSQLKLEPVTPSMSDSGSSGPFTPSSSTSNSVLGSRTNSMAS